MASTWPLHQLIVIEGTTTGGDIWSTSLKTIYGASPGLQISFEDQETMLKSTEDPPVIGLWKVVRDWWTAAAAGTYGAFRSSEVLTAVKFNAIGHDGKYFFPDTNEYIYSPSVPGVSPTGGDPRQSLVTTLRAEYDRGRGAYGRMYPPQRDLPYEAGATQISASKATDVLNSALALINGINAISVGGVGLTVVNISPGDANKPVVVSPVTRVEVDRTMDTQRRRTNAFARAVVAGTVG